MMGCDEERYITLSDEAARRRDNNHGTAKSDCENSTPRELITFAQAAASWHVHTKSTTRGTNGQVVGGLERAILFTSKKPSSALKQTIRRNDISNMYIKHFWYNI